MKPAALSIDSLTRAVHSLPNDALAAARKTALANIGAEDLPTVRHEDWKYTDLATAIDISNRWLTDGAGTIPVDPLADSVKAICASIDANWLIVANGRVDLSHFTQDSAISVERFSDTAAPSVAARPLAHFNMALLHDGLRVHIHAATERPLGVLLIDASPAGAVASQANLEIDVAPGCDAEIVEYHSSSGSGDHYGNSVIALQLGQAARASYVRIQNRRIGHVQTGRLSVALAADSQLCMASYDLGGGLIRNDVEIDLNEAGSDATFCGLYLAGDGQHIDNHTRVDHRVGPATSAQEYRGILSGDARGVWNGKAVVHKGADGTDARQANHNLLLSDKAEIDAKPELEIYADDVKCGHGTTVGQLDAAALFYLRTRGLNRQQATQILTHAFADELVARAPVSAAADAIAALVAARLAELIKDGLS